MDIGPWDDAVGHVKNGLVDDEIGALIDSLREKGADVWAVFDSCHSGTVTRGAPTGDAEVRMRKLDGAALGIPDAALAQAESEAQPARRPARQAPVDAVAAREGAGSLVAFFAAQTTEVTPEMRLPSGKKGRKSHGLFTWTIFEALAASPGLTYRQLAQDVLRRYAVGYMTNPTPLFEGDLDRPVFGLGEAEVIRQWPVTVSGDALTLPAGSLHRLAEGEVLALLPGPAAMLSDAIGYVSVSAADTLSSTAMPVERDGKPALAADAIPQGAYARRIANDFEFGLTVAMPEFAEADPAAAELARAAIALMPEHADDGLRVEFVEAGKPADLRLSVLSPRQAAVAGDETLARHLFFLPPTGDIVLEGPGKSPSITFDGKDAGAVAEAMADNLKRISRAVNLLKLGGASGGSTLDVAVELRTRNKAKPELASLDPASVPVLVPGDEVHLRAQNRMDVPVDINVLYVGADYSIQHIWAGRAQPGDTLPKGLVRLNDSSFGRERVVVILTPAKPLTAVEDLSFLAQKAVPQTREVPKPGGGLSFKGLLREAGFGAATRGAELLEDEPSEESRGAIIQLEIDVEPAQ